MSTTAKIGHGIQFQRGDGGSPENFTTVAEVKNVTGPGLQADALDVTHADSPDAHREFIDGLKNGGEVSVEANWLPSDTTQNVSGVAGDVQAGTKGNWKIVWPGGSPTWSFTAIVTGVTPTAPVDSPMSVSITLQISGKPTLA